MPIPENQPSSRDWIFNGFVVGGSAGAVIGFGVVTWFRLTGEWMKYPHIYVAFWTLVGALVGLFAGVVHRLLKRRH